MSDSRAMALGIEKAEAHFRVPALAIIWKHIFYYQNWVTARISVAG
jgi:hypothetical protein